MEKTKIDWCESTWNPVTGCLHRCEYCYARSIAKRFSYEGATLDAPPELQRIWIIDSKGSGYGNHVLRYPVDTIDGKKVPYPYGFAPTFHKYRLREYQKKKSRNIFVCSMADLFGDWVPDEWITEVFSACKAAPQHNYFFLTKNAKRYAELGELLPSNNNMWYGISITKESEVHNFNFLPAFRNTFVSIEPLLEDFCVEQHNILFRQVDWFIIGAETGNRKNKVVPKREWIEEIVYECKGNNKPVFMKESLKDIWKKPLIQEYPL